MYQTAGTGAQGGAVQNCEIYRYTVHNKYSSPYRRLRGVVATGAIRERLVQGGPPVYPTILVVYTNFRTLEEINF